MESVLDHSRRILADANALLELEIERLFGQQVEGIEDPKLADLKGLLTHTNKARQQVVEMLASAGVSAAGSPPGLDLEAARDEILRRLDRLLERGDAGGVSGRAVGECSGSDAVALERVGEPAAPDGTGG